MMLAMRSKPPVARAKPPKEDPETKRYRAMQREIAQVEQQEATRAKAKLPARERDGSVGGTGATIIRLSASALVRLHANKRIGRDELDAAAEIAAAFHAITGAVGVKTMSWLSPRGGTGDWGVEFAHLVQRYTRWADRWSKRRLTHRDPTLAIVIAVVVDEQTLSVVQADYGMRYERVRELLIKGLQDYARRANREGGMRR